MNHTLKPEWELLINCSRLDRNEERNDRLAELNRSELDWNFILEKSIHHRWCALIKRQAKVGLIRIPDAIEEKIDKQIRLHTISSLRLCAQMIKIMRLFESKGVPLLPIKGPLMTEELYQDQSLRVYTDLDFFISPANLQAGIDILVEAGYMLRRERYKLRQQKRFGYHLAFLPHDQSFVIELHWRLFAPHFHFPLGFEECWAKRREISFQGESFPFLDLHQHFLYVCAHACKHRWLWLSMLSDCQRYNHLHELESSGELRDLARKLHATKILDITFAFMHMIHESSEAGSQEKHTKYWDTLFAFLFEGTKLSQRQARLLDHAYLNTTTSRFIRMFVPRTLDTLSLNLPAPLYYLLRPLLLMARQFPRTKRVMKLRRANRAIPSTDLPSGNRYPWYDSQWINSWFHVKSYIQRECPEKLDNFDKSFEILKTPMAFKPRLLEKPFSDEEHDKMRKLIAEFQDRDLEGHEQDRFGRMILHNHDWFNALQVAITERMSRWVGEEVVPSYNFLSLYREAGRCEPHLDALEAKWTLDYCIDQSAPWPIHLSRVFDWTQGVAVPSSLDWREEIRRNPEHHFESFALQPRQALIFSGSSQWHYRESIPRVQSKNFCHLVFFHFIPKDSQELVEPERWPKKFALPGLSLVNDAHAKAE